MNSTWRIGITHHFIGIRLIIFKTISSSSSGESLLSPFAPKPHRCTVRGTSAQIRGSSSPPATMLAENCNIFITMVALWYVLLRICIVYATLTTVERISLPTPSDFCELVTGLDFTFSTSALGPIWYQWFHLCQFIITWTRWARLLYRCWSALESRCDVRTDQSKIREELRTKTERCLSEQKIIIVVSVLCAWMYQYYVPECTECIITMYLNAALCTWMYHYYVPECISTMYLNVGRFWLLELEVPVLVSRNAVPQSTGQRQTAILTIVIMIGWPSEMKDDMKEGKCWKWRNWHLLKVEASGGKEAPASLLVSLNGVGDSAGSVAENSKFTFYF